jgi:cellulose synthase/poly-beta-1,6-N-acetylglucosamine synthase-like glycosyltransferase
VLILLQWAEGLLLLALLLPASVFILQTVLGSFYPGGKELLHASGAADTPSIATVCLLMPAHNEAVGIVPVITALLPRLQRHIRLLVVADNCSDNTAELIRATAGASTAVQVVERFDPALRGKGYALDFGVRHLAAKPPEVVIIVDADCELSDHCIDILTQRTLQTGRPAQALYLMLSPAGAKLKTRLAEFAWLIKNMVRPLGFLRIGMPCQLMGTGMAFQWPHLAHAKLHSGHIVEDMKLGIDLALAGSPPVFCPQAMVHSYFPATETGLKTQRQRWEHGHLSTIFSEVPGLLRQFLVRRRLTILGMALELCVPPVALLVVLLFAAVLASALQWALTGIVWPLLLTAAALATLFLSVLLAWQRYAKHIISFYQLVSLPQYVLMKLPVYVLFIFKRQAEWVRTKRDEK